jgi:putative phosphoesterase
VLIGLISDTHGLLRDEALAALAGSDAIVHAGDIGGSVILERLALLAPVTAVRGNNDVEPWAEAIPERRALEAQGVTILVVHDLHAIGDVPKGVRAVVHGHSHRPSIAERDGVLFVNPGSAGPRRFALPVSVGELVVARGDVRARLVELPPPAPARLNSDVATRDMPETTMGNRDRQRKEPKKPKQPKKPKA